MPLLPKEKAAEELAERGLTVVPRAVHGVTAEQIDHLADCILARAEETTGTPRCRLRPHGDRTSYSTAPPCMAPTPSKRRARG